MRSLSVFCCCAVLCLTTLGYAANWPQFRGPSFNGSTDEQKLPSQWSQSENVVWAAQLPGAAAATPIVWENRVFVSSTDTSANALVAMCFDRRTGELKWRHKVADGIRLDTRSNYASPTPATDGKVIVFFYGTGDLAVLDFSGKELWSWNVQDEFGPFAFNWTFSTSPLLYDGKLIMQVLQRDVPVDGRGFADRENESYLLALDPQTGKILWKNKRPSEAQAESREAFSSPVPFEFAGRKELLVVGGDDVTGHDPSTGDELWRWGTWNPQRIGHWRLVPSPVASEDMVLVCAPKKSPVFAVKAGGSGLLDDGAIAWDSTEQREITSDVPTPAYYDGDFFVLSDLRKSLSRVDPRTGGIKWSVRTPGRMKYEASPLAADNKIYLVNFDGEVVVMDADDGSVINVIPMDEPAEDNVRSSVVAAHGHLFIRTNTTLFCIGE